jgi:hypothetical protein
MARIDSFAETRMERNSVHNPVSATYTVFTSADGETYLQIDTYGSDERKIVGKKSQSIQLSPSGLAALREILDRL